jgi:hypothetical protein
VGGPVQEAGFPAPTKIESGRLLVMSLTCCPVKNEFLYANGYYCLDNIGAHDEVVFVPDLKIEICEEFIPHYASSGMEDVIFD